MRARATLEELKPYIPTVCPTCGSPLKLSDDLMHLRCTNPNCSGAISRRLENMAKALGIDLIGEKTAEQLVERNSMTSEVDLFTIPREGFRIGTFKDASVDKINDEVHKYLKVEWSDFINALQISRVGLGTSRDFSAIFKSIDELLNVTAEDLANRMDHATVELTKQIVRDIEHRSNNIKRLYEYVVSHGEIVFPDLSKRTKSAVVVITGKISMGRKQFQDKYSKLGFTFASSVTSNTDYLICEDPNSNSSKAKNARKFGTKILTEEQFIKEIVGE